MSILGYYRYYYDVTYLLVIIGAVLSMIASAQVNGAFKRYSTVRSMSGMTGAQAARRILDQNGLYNVKIEHVSGNLTDHYDPRSKVLRLSASNLRQRKRGRGGRCGSRVRSCGAGQ